MADITDDFTANTATTGKLAVGTPSSGTFENAGDSDWFAVSLQAGTKYMLAVDSLSYSFQGFSLALNDASGKQIGSAEHGTQYNKPTIEYTPAVSGTFFLKAFSTNGYGAYSVSATVRTAPDDFSGNTGTSGVLVPGKTANGSIEVTGDHDWFRFHAEANGHYLFGIKMPGTGTDGGPAIAPDFVLRDASGEVLTGAIYPLEPISAGDYYVDVVNDTAGSYTIVSSVLSDDFSQNNQTTGALQAGGQANGTIERSWDVDRFKITLDSQYFYTFKLAASAPVDYNDLTLTLRNAAGEGLSFANALYTPQGPTFTFRPSTSGVYYADVASYYSYTAGDQVPLPYTLTASGPIADDYGDTPATATLMQVGATVYGTSQNAADADMVKLMLEGGKTYTVQLNNHGTQVTGWSDLTLTILGTTGQSLASVSGYGAPNYYTFTPSTSGGYYFAASRATTEFSLTVTAEDDDFGASVASAGTLAIGSSLSGTLEKGGGDRDWFAVTLTAGSTYWFSAKSTSSDFTHGGLLRLLDKAGNELAQTTSTSYSSIADTLPYLVSKSGTYYVELSSPDRYTGSYTVSAAVGERDDFGSTPASAGRLDTSTPVQGKLEIPTDKDTFKLSVTAGTTYGLNVKVPNNQPSVSAEAVDSSGNPVWLESWRPVNQGIDGYLFDARQSGDVYITVRGGSSEALSYTISAIAFGLDDYSSDNQTTANLAQGGSLQGTLSHPHDVDYVRVKLEAGKSYVFELLAATSGNGTLNTSGLGFGIRSDTAYSLQTTTLESGAEPRMAFTPSASGDYYLTIRANYDGQMGSYTVKALTLSGDASGPVLLSQSHAHGATGLALTDTTIGLTFSEPITIDRSAVVLKDSSGNAVPLAYVSGVDYPWVNDNQLVIKANGILAPGTYTLSMPHTAIHDLAGNQHTAAETLTFSTVLPVATPTSGSDLLNGGAGIAIDGGAGIDMVLYKDYEYFHTIKRDGATVTVRSYSTDKTDTLSNVERLLFGRDAYALDIDGNGGQAYRLYRAAFDRTPDSAGLGYWIGQLDKGVSQHDVARNFVGSTEFKTLYGAAPSDAAYVDQLYKNVLHRPADTAGASYWGEALANGMSRADVLIMFSDSPENKAALIGTIGNGFSYTMY